ncbi:MAG: DMT family transporter [Lachnospiraceae bacterium]|jgi:transporter family-2 protein|nr:DMT family transporter [Lachnospiraceae bacterium]MCI8995469.1 DMT family transporter [Lachnospiraceae bacterium]MCI9134254.1 DMT family transporter [Lachnospiraceae bacterium]
MLYSLLVLLAGMLQSAMLSFNGLLSDFIGLFGVTLVVHVTGGMLLALYIALFVRKRITLRGMPWYLYSAGFFGVFLVSVSSYCVGILGAAATTCLSVAGQLFISAVIDHYGMFQVPKVAFSTKRIPCFLIILAGIILLNLS